MSTPLDVVVIGLSITSSWGNGHATTYRALLKGMARRGHRITFFEQNRPFYANNRDVARFEGFDVVLYDDVAELRDRYAVNVRNADAVIVGSYVADGIDVIDWVLANARGVRAFYDIDTPVTLGQLANDHCEYLRRRQIPAFDVVFSFSGGAALSCLERDYGARRAIALYCSVDEDAYRPRAVAPTIDLGYMGTYSSDRQPLVETLLLAPARALPARRFVVAGPQYPSDIAWPANVARIEHLAPNAHADFYASQRFTLNVTRRDMRALGHSPSVRLFEAAACGTPIVSDDWPGLSEFFVDGEEILVAHDTGDVCRYLTSLTNAQRTRIAERARERVLALHTGAQRAAELEQHLYAARPTQPGRQTHAVS